MTDEHPSRAEFQMLREAVMANASRLDVIDATGTRGVGVLSVQVGEVIKDVAALQVDLNQHRTEHQREAAAAAGAKVTQHRWRVGTAIAAVSAWAALVSILLDVASHVR